MATADLYNASVEPLYETHHVVSVYRKFVLLSAEYHRRNYTLNLIQYFYLFNLKKT